MTGGGGPTRRAVLAGGVSLVAAVPALGQIGPADTLAPAGRYIGERLPSGVHRYLGIRYGRAARFQRPVPIRQQRAPIRAVSFGPVAPQRGWRGPQSEDCLFLNIWTPTTDPRSRLPVMVYVHGGAFHYGSATDPENDGGRLAERGVVVVTINHRLNAFGYLYLAALEPRFPDSGNAGQLDLVLGLNWIRDNIAAFGGDPGRVMAFGDSGGGGKITTLLAMPAAAGLVHRAATMSGQQVTVSGPIKAARRARAYLAKLGIAENDLANLLIAPPERLLEGLDAVDPVEGGPLYFGPVLDQRNILRHPFWPDAHPLSLAVPMMTGNARDEMRGFYVPDSEFVQGISWSNVASRIGDELPVDLPPGRIVREYRRRLPAASPADIFFAATTDGRSWRGQIEVAEARARAGRPVWFYQVDFTSRADPRLGAFHCIDVPLIFGNYDHQRARTGSDPSVRLMSRTIQDRFVAFSHSGDPTVPGKPAWQPYDLSSRATMIFDETTRLEKDPRRWQRELFAVAPYRQPGS